MFEPLVLADWESIRHRERSIVREHSKDRCWSIDLNECDTNRAVCPRIDRVPTARSEGQLTDREHRCNKNQLEFWWKMRMNSSFTSRILVPNLDLNLWQRLSSIWHCRFSKQHTNNFHLIETKTKQILKGINRENKLSENWILAALTNTQSRSDDDDVDDDMKRSSNHEIELIFCQQEFTVECAQGTDIHSFGKQKKHRRLNKANPICWSRYDVVVVDLSLTRFS